MPMLATACCLELGEVPVALLIWDYSRAGATDSFTGIINAPNPRLDFAVSKPVGIPLERRNVPYATLLPMLARYLCDRPKTEARIFASQKSVLQCILAGLLMVYTKQDWETMHSLLVATIAVLSAPLST